MTFRSSDIGYLMYDDVIVPITRVEIRDGRIMFYSEFQTGPDETITIDENGPVTFIGVDGSQALWAERTGPPLAKTVSHGGVLYVTQAHTTTVAQRGSS